MKTALLIIQMIPAIIDIVKKAEEILAGQGKGKEKLAFVKEMLEAIHNGLIDNWPVVENVIGIIVKYMNTWGIFKK